MQADELTRHSRRGYMSANSVYEAARCHIFAYVFARIGRSHKGAILQLSTKRPAHLENVG
jgi:hypothetical protein